MLILSPVLLQVLLQDPKERYALPLAQKQQLNHDTFFLRFALPTPEFKLGLPCGKHVFLCAGNLVCHALHWLLPSMHAAVQSKSFAGIMLSCWVGVCVLQTQQATQ